MHVLIENLFLCLLYDYNSFNNNCSLQKKKRYNFADGPAYCMSKKLMNEMKRSVRFIMLLIIIMYNNLYFTEEKDSLPFLVINQYLMILQLDL